MGCSPKDCQESDTTEMSIQAELMFTGLPTKLGKDPIFRLQAQSSTLHQSVLPSLLSQLSYLRCFVCDFFFFHILSGDELTVAFYPTPRYLCDLPESL